MRTRPLVTLLSTPLLALLVSCGGGGFEPPAPAGEKTNAGQSQPAEAAPTAAPSAETTPSGFDPTMVNSCELLTHEDAETLAGTPLDEGIAGDPGNPLCIYTGPVTGPTAQVEIYVGDGAKKYYDIDVELGHEFWPVPGVGDEAYSEGLTLFFRVSTTWVSIRLVRLHDWELYTQPLEALAATVADRLNDLMDQS